jgi:hypothetical protein
MANQVQLTGEVNDKTEDEFSLPRTSRRQSLLMPTATITDRDDCARYGPRHGFPKALAAGTACLETLRAPPSHGPCGPGRRGRPHLSRR